MGIRRVRFDEDNLAAHDQYRRQAKLRKKQLNVLQWVVVMVASILWLVGAVELAKVAGDLRRTRSSVELFEADLNNTLLRLDALEDQQNGDSGVSFSPVIERILAPVTIHPHTPIPVLLPHQFTDPDVVFSGWFAFNVSHALARNTTAHRPIRTALVELNTRVGGGSQLPGSLLVRFGGDGHGDGVVWVWHSAPSALAPRAFGSKFHRVLVPLDSEMRLWVSKVGAPQHHSAVVQLRIVGLL